MERAAMFDRTGTFRYLLSRHWSKEKGSILFIMLNPSTANAEIDDPTVRRCINFAKSWGYGGIEVVNLFALVSPDPKRLLTALDPVGPENDTFILDAADRAEIIIAAWGAFHEASIRSERVLRLLSERGYDIYCLGATKGGRPRHPLYLKKDTEPQLFYLRSISKTMVKGSDKSA